MIQYNWTVYEEYSALQKYCLTSKIEQKWVHTKYYTQQLKFSTQETGETNYLHYNKNDFYNYFFKYFLSYIYVQKLIAPRRNILNQCKIVILEKTN